MSLTKLEIVDTDEQNPDPIDKIIKLEMLSSSHAIYLMVGFFGPVKDTLASDSGIFNIRGCEKKLYHHVRLVKKILFPCPEI